jgi:aminocarboxymuconate-semialdehyde decarboxylase
MIVDVHTHVIVPEITRDGGGDEPWRPSVRWEDGAQLIEFGGQTLRSATREFVDIDRILEEQARSGVEHVVLSPWVALLPYALDAGEALAVCRLQNDALVAIVAAHPERVSALAAVPLQDPAAAAEELESVMAVPGMVGVEVAASVRGEYLGDDRFLPFWEAAEGAGALVFVHPTARGIDVAALGEYYLWNTVGNPLQTAIAGAHLVMSGVLERHPRLRVVLAHGGGALPSVRGRLRHAHTFQPQARARLNDPPDESLRRLYYDTVTHDAALLRDLVGFAGADHVLLGSDYPFDMGTVRPAEEVRELGLPPSDEAAVLGGNVERLMGLGERTAR